MLSFCLYLCPSYFCSSWYLCLSCTCQIQLVSDYLTHVPLKSVTAKHVQPQPTSLRHDFHRLAQPHKLGVLPLHWINPKLKSLCRLYKGKLASPNMTKTDDKDNKTRRRKIRRCHDIVFPDLLKPKECKITHHVCSSHCIHICLENWNIPLQNICFTISPNKHNKLPNLGGHEIVAWFSETRWGSNSEALEGFGHGTMIIHDLSRKVVRQKHCCHNWQIYHGPLEICGAAEIKGQMFWRWFAQIVSL